VIGSEEAASLAPELWLGMHLPALASREGTPMELERLATRSQRFTPRVSLVPPDGLLLEVKGSLHLFGGTEGLTRAVAAECLGLELESTLALAPVPLAALAAARASKPMIVTTLAQLVGQLAPLPLAVLRWPPETLDRLASMGVRCIGQALRLPRAGFARRFGPEQLAALEQLVGREPDLRSRFEPRERFRRRRELLYELEHHDRLLEKLAPLLTALGQFLTVRQQGLLVLECRLGHRQAPPTSCVLRLAAPQADAQRLTELLAERLRTLSLPEPVRSIELRSGPLVPLPQQAASLWQPGEHGGTSASLGTDLIERLRARLGPTAVYGLKVVPGHRPETAWGATEPWAGGRPAGHSPSANRRSAQEGQAWPQGGQPLSAPGPALRRPVWLLSAPQRLCERAGKPWRHGPLRLLSGPERIETGWWDGGEVRRDYYMACDSSGARLWIFREHAAPRGWYLHGVWG
jgi:protein ImuB